MHIRRTAAALAAGAALLTGCSSGGGHDDAESTPRATSAAPTVTTAAATGTPQATGDDRAALTAAVRAYSAAYFKPDPAAAGALLSERCRAQSSAAAYRAALARAVAAYGHQQVKTVTVDRLSAPLALVSYTYSVPVLDQHGQPWVLEGGAWRYDAC